MPADVKILFKIAKQTIDKERYKIIKKIKEEKEIISVLKYSIITKLERELHSLEKKVKNKERIAKDVFFAKTKLIMLRNKIKNFSVSFSDEEYNKVMGLFLDIKKEIQDV